MNEDPAIQEAWQSEKCPIMNGIVFDSGEIALLAFRNLQVRGNWITLLDPAGRTTLESFLAEHPDQWAAITTLGETSSEPLGLHMFCGEGSSGGDGFVAACRAADNHVNWIAFFEHSNPFEYIEIQGSDALAVNNCQQIWRFPLTRPELCCVVK